MGHCGWTPLASCAAVECLAHRELECFPWAGPSFCHAMEGSRSLMDTLKKRKKKEGEGNCFY